MRQNVIFLTLFGLFGYIAAKYPSDLPRCHFGDTKCIERVIEEFVRKIKNGRRDLGMIPVDPLQIDEISIEQRSKIPVNIKVKLRNLKCYGISTATVEKVVGFQRDLAKSKFEIYVKIPRISLDGFFKSRGNILFLPIFGSGAVNLTLDEIDANVKFKAKVVVKKGKNHLKFVNLIMDFEMKKLSMHFENLFNNDPLLSRTSNKFLNDNWRIIVREIKPDVIKAIVAVFKGFAEPIFVKHPYEEVFLRDDED